jgi:hypothetical protein
METKTQGIDIEMLKGDIMPGNNKASLIAAQDWNKFDQDTTINQRLLEKCAAYHSALADFRRRRRRNRLYYRGDQWKEAIVDPDSGNTITEEQHILNQGRIPFKQNVIRPLVRNIVGQFRVNPFKSLVIARARENATISEMYTNVLESSLDVNEAKETDARMLEEFLLSGMAIWKVGFQFWENKNIEDAFIENGNPGRMFFNPDISDVRLHDLKLIGEFIDTDIESLISVFAKNKDEEQQIRQLYVGVDRRLPIQLTKALSSDRNDSLTFYLSDDPQLCRIFEVWERKGEWRVYAHDYLDGSYQITTLTMKEIAEINSARVELGMSQGMSVDKIPMIEAREHYDQFWYVKFLTPEGYCLYEGETPYKHGEHPYVLGLYPFLDGEVWGLVEDLIDQQRYINRIISLLDAIMGASAKGVLLVPEDSIPADMTIDDFAEEWTKFNGVIKIKLKPGAALPQQIHAKSVDIGAQELLALQMKLIMEISGVSSAIQGHATLSGTPSSLYAQQAQNSTINTRDIIDSFAHAKMKRDMKVLKTCIQYYKDERYIDISGKNYTPEASYYKPDMAKLDFSMKIAQGNDTAVYRQMIDDTLIRLLEMQQIDVKMFFENTSLPFADRILQSINIRQQQMAQGQPGQQLPPDQAQAIQGANQQAQQQVDPKAMEMMNRYLETRAA